MPVLLLCSAGNISDASTCTAPCNGGNGGLLWGSGGAGALGGTGGPGGTKGDNGANGSPDPAP
jgi:hypothetical protein